MVERGRWEREDTKTQTVNKSQRFIILECIRYDLPSTGRQPWLSSRKSTNSSHLRLPCETTKLSLLFWMTFFRLRLLLATPGNPVFLPPKRRIVCLTSCGIILSQERKCVRLLVTSARAIEELLLQTATEQQQECVVLFGQSCERSSDESEWNSVTGRITVKKAAMGERESLLSFMERNKRW
ncbi:hypothetical protein R1flu_016095 [Riccia fluitans]|uniref:Uncharacterized protein n=1 Tax=Riccia fluitans TaxID=41844 RepID=A0ABD1YLV8_9MARC